MRATIGGFAIQKELFTTKIVTAARGWRINCTDIVVAEQRHRSVPYEKLVRSRHLLVGLFENDAYFERVEEKPDTPP